MLILDEVSGRHLVTANPEVGTRWPLHATSTGKAILGALSDDERRQLLRFPLPRFTPNTITTRRELAMELEQILTLGYATTVEELESGFVAVGAAFRGAMGEVRGAVSVQGPVSRIDAARLPHLGKELILTVRRISEALGYEDRAVSDGGTQSLRKSPY
jgi:DNA-binding IclR family transcriptional regulator